MSNDTRVAITQFIGLIVLILGNFGVNVSPETQVQIVNGLAAGGLLLTTLIAMWPTIRATWRGDAGAPPSNQGGFARIGMLATIAAVAALAMSACVTKPTTSSVIAAASRTILEVGVQVDQAQKIGLITDAKEDELIDHLKRANGELRRAHGLYLSCGQSKCREAEDVLAAVYFILAEVQKEIVK